METYNLEKLQKKLKKELDEDRYRHTLGVMYTAAALAMRYEEDLNQAQTAGLLHDCAKCLPDDKKLKLCTQNNLEISEAEQRAPFLLHAKVGAFLAEEKYDVHDPEILSAIACHTTGKPEMTPLEKIIFTADYIEPMRTKAENLTEIRRLAFCDLDLCVFTILRDTLDYLEAKKAFLDNQTIISYNYYKKLIDEREEP